MTATEPDVTLETIRHLGSLLDDLEQVRIANGNRIAAFTDQLAIEPAHLIAIQDRLAAVEHEAELELVRAWRRHPLAPWAREIKGCGEKLIARLIAEIGDPAVRGVGHREKLPNGRWQWVIDGWEPRGAYQLLAYCGHGDPRRSELPQGATQEELFKRGSPAAKKAAWKLGFQFMRTPGSQYREVYDQWRERYEGHVHERACKRCGPAGKPAPAGSPWSAQHQHMAAIRNTTKSFLLDLWREARRLAPQPVEA